MIYEQNDKSAIIVFNGEIYNFESIRKELKSKGYTFNSRTDMRYYLQVISNGVSIA